MNKEYLIISLDLPLLEKKLFKNLRFVKYEMAVAAGW